MSSNNEKIYKECFVEALSIENDSKLESLKFNEIDEWDSIGHMTLISELEEKFSISIETEDVIDFSSYAKGKEIIAKYGIAFS